MKITHDWDQGKNVKHLIKMKGHKFDAAKIYFQKPGVCTTQRATGDGGKLTELHSHLERLFARCTYVCKITGKSRTQCLQKIRERT